ncbi:MAG: ABC transporter ATP-binding protein [Desulfobacterales bacterium]|nr:ABC transporter ATP-binding protein [Desulfobacterales bacterium]
MNEVSQSPSRLPAEFLLRIEQVTKRFSGLTALKGVSFGIRRGHIKALIGPNGAGKTTLLNVISGLSRPEEGHIYCKGRDLLTMKPHQIAGLGISRTFQLVRLFTTNNATVMDNLLMGAHLRLKPSVTKSLFMRGYTRKQESDVCERALETLRFVGIEWAKDYSPSALSFGNKRLLEIARALMAEPDVLLLDEPASGLNDAEVEEFRELLLAIKARGLTTLLVEHNMKLVMDIADEIIVLEFGQKLAEGSADEICCDRRVIEAYLGSDYSRAQRGS